jgi:predicted ester cyclase
MVVDEVANQGKLNSAAEYVYPEVVAQVPLTGQGLGLEGLENILRAMRSAFPEFDFSIKEQIAEGRFKDTRILMDSLGLMMQLGVLPPPAP